MFVKFTYLLILWYEAVSFAVEFILVTVLFLIYFFMITILLDVGLVTSSHFFYFICCNTATVFENMLLAAITALLFRCVTCGPLC